MKQVNIGNMKHVGEQNQEWGYEQISRNDKAGDNRPNRARPEDHRRLRAGSEARKVTWGVAGLELHSRVESRINLIKLIRGAYRKDVILSKVLEALQEHPRFRV